MLSSQVLYIKGMNLQVYGVQGLDSTPNEYFGMKDKLLKSLTVVFFVGCAVGVTYQISLMSSNYFEYRTTTEIRIELPKKVSRMAISICTRYVDHLDYEQIRRESPGKFRSNWHFTHDVNWIRKYQHELTVDEILRFTPEINSILFKMAYRVSHSYESRVSNGSSIYDLLEVEKYLYLEFICYKLYQKSGEDISYSSLSVTPTASGEILHIVLNKTLDRANMMKIAIHSQRNRPYRSLMFTPVQRRSYDAKDQVAQYNSFSSYSTLLHTRNLPPPYDTKCFDYERIGLASTTECIEECIKTRVIQKLNKIPFSFMVNESIDMKMVSYLDVIRPETAKTLFQIQHVCSEICSHRSCKDLTEMTFTTSTMFPVFILRVIVPLYPSIFITANPALKLVEFLTQVMSILSTWTGVSIMSLNPGVFYALKKQQVYQIAAKKNSKIQLFLRRVSKGHNRVSFFLRSNRVKQLSRPVSQKIQH